jgi:hypothetical protein
LPFISSGDGTYGAPAARRQFPFGSAPNSPRDASGSDRITDLPYPAIATAASPTRTGDGIGFVVIVPPAHSSAPVARS